MQPDANTPVNQLAERFWESILELQPTLATTYGDERYGDRLVRLLLVPPERSELLRHKLDRSVALSDAFRAGNWHVLKWNHLATFLAREPMDLGGLEPLLGFEPAVEQSGEQLPLFHGER